MAGGKKGEKLETVDQNLPFLNFVTTQYMFIKSFKEAKKRRQSIGQTQYTLIPPLYVILKVQ